MLSRPVALSTHTRYEALDGMRGIAAICVMVFHYVKGGGHPFLNNSPLAVDLFFMLSGFVIAHSYGQRLHASMSALQYIGRRLIRLYPMFLAGIFLGAPILYWMQQSALSNGTPGFIARSLAFNLFYLPSFNGIATHGTGSAVATVGELFPTDPPAWSLFFEMVASVAFIALVQLKRTGLIATVAASLAAFVLVGVTYALLHHRYECDLDQGWNLATFWGGFPRVIYGFTVGLLLYSVVNDMSMSTIRSIFERFINSSFVLYFILILVFMFPVQLRGLYSALILVVVAPSLVFAGSLIPCTSAATLNTARFLGWISYPLYCLHAPIGNAVFLIAHRAHLAPSIAIISSIILSLLASIVLTRFYEEPVRAYLTRKLK